MISLYYFPTPNGKKVSILLEELGLSYQLHLVDILDRQQFSEEFLQINPNNKIPAIIDHDVDSYVESEPITVFESGAILIYLAEKTGKLLPKDVRGRTEVMQWLMWQMGGLGPMAGQANHFNKYATDNVPYGVKRYTEELGRLYRVMDKRLAAREYLCNEYSIADIACYGWVEQADVGGQSLADFPNVAAWFMRMSARPAVIKGCQVGAENTPPTVLSAKQHKSLFSD